MARSKATFLGFFSSQVFMIINMLLAMVTTPMILKFLNKEEYGLYTILFQIMGYLTLFDFGLGSAIARTLAATRGDDEKSRTFFNKVISTSFYTYLILGAFVIVIGVCLSPLLPDFFHMSKDLEGVTTSIAITLSIIIGLQFPIRVFSGIFFSHQKQLLSNITGFIWGIMNIVLPVIFLYFGYGLWSFVYTNIIIVVTDITINSILIRRFYPYLKIKLLYFDKSLLKEMYSFGFFIFLNAIAVQVVFFTDRFFIGSLVSLSAVTIYYLTAKIPEICMNLIFKISDNAYPAIVEIHAQRDIAKFKIIHQRLLITTVCFSTIAFWLVLIFNKPFLHLWVGDSFFAGEQILLLSLALMTFHTIIHVSSICLNGAGLVKGFSILSLLEATINLVLTITLGKLYGIQGILIATVIAIFLTSGWYTPFITIKYLKISLGDYLVKGILIPAASISFMGYALYKIYNIFLERFEPTWVSLIGLGAIFSSVLLVLSWLFFLKRQLAEYIPKKFQKFLFIMS